MLSKICLLHAGELGTALGEMVTANGCRVTTVASCRSKRTLENAANAGFEIRETVAQAIHEAEAVFSVVPPANALDLATSVLEETPSHSNPLIYVDFNSISPVTASQIEQLFQGSTIQFIDASIHGQANNLSTNGTLFLSGSESKIVANLFQGLLRVRILGDKTGLASLQKMLLGSITKGTIALFLQAAILAETTSLTEAFVTDLQHFYPETWRFIERSFPTYPVHGHRRVGEIQQLQETLLHYELPDGLAHEMSDHIRLLGNCKKEGSDDSVNEIQRIVQHVVKNHHAKNEEADNS